MKKLILAVFVAFLLISPYALAGRAGDICNYAVRGDAECDPANNIYCINDVCTVYTGPTDEYCTDSDGNDEWVYGQVDFLYRASNGQFIEGIVTDGCMLDSSPVASCGVVRGCTVDEWVCIPEGGLPYSSQSYACADGCNSGKCVDNTEPNSWLSVGGNYTEATYPGAISGGATDSETGLKRVEISVKRDSDNYYWNGSSWVSGETWRTATGTDNWSYTIAFSNFSEGTYTLKSKATDMADNVQSTPAENTMTIIIDGGSEQTPCNYGLNLDSECDTGNNFYCIDGYCTELESAPEIVCDDSDDANAFNKGKVDYTYRESDGGIVSGSKWDSCSNDSVIEYYCLGSVPDYGENYDSNILACDNGCSQGACISAADGNAGDGEPECTIDADCEGTEVLVDCGEKGHEIKCVEGSCVAQCLSDFPETVSDQELLQYIDQWSKGEISDVEIMEIIEIWKNS